MHQRLPLTKSRKTESVSGAGGLQREISFAPKRGQRFGAEADRPGLGDGIVGRKKTRGKKFLKTQQLGKKIVAGGGGVFEGNVGPGARVEASSRLNGSIESGADGPRRKGEILGGGGGGSEGRSAGS